MNSKKSSKTRLNQSTNKIQEIGNDEVVPLTKDGENDDEDVVDDKKYEYAGSASFIDPRTIRWMNKRRPNPIAQASSRAPPSRLKQLKAIFNGFEQDDDGRINLQNFKNAVDFINERDSTGWTSDTMTIQELFSTFHSNKGTIDFQDFVNAMTSGSHDNHDSSRKDISNRQQAFFDIATKHRRQKLIENLSSSDTDDLHKYRNFTKLFEVQYFPDEPIVDIVDENPTIQSKAVSQNLTEKQRHVRNEEVIRSRLASMVLTSPQKLSHTAPYSRHQPTGTLCNADQKKIQMRLSKYKIRDSTFVPPDNRTLKASLKLRMQATREASQLLRHDCSTFSLPPI